MKLDPKAFNLIVMIAVGVWAAALLCPMFLDLTQSQVTQANLAAISATGLLAGLGVSKGQKDDEGDGLIVKKLPDDRNAG